MCNVEKLSYENLIIANLSAECGIAKKCLLDRGMVMIAYRSNIHRKHRHKRQWSILGKALSKKVDDIEKSYFMI